MKSILLVKTSSLGDVVHNLPLASDLHAAFPDADIEWVVEEAFTAVVGLHPAVRRVLPVAIRRWRSAPWRRQTREEIRRFVRQLRERVYDAVLDTQGLLKSALVARAARGVRFGFDWRSAREPLAPFYDRTFRVPRSWHAVERNRALGGQALHYAPRAGVDFGIRAAAAPPVGLTQHYAVLLHATSAERKLWPEARWIEVGRYLQSRGIASVLPWGSATERARSERLAGEVPQAVVPPFLAIGEAAGLLAGARAVVGVDTGLTHLAAALGVATIGIYCTTDPGRTGLYGSTRAANLGGPGATPTAQNVVAALARVSGLAAARTDA